MDGIAFTAGETGKSFAFFNDLRHHGVMLDFNAEDSDSGVIAVWVKHRGPVEHSTYLTLSKVRQSRLFWLIFVRRTRYIMDVHASGPASNARSGVAVCSTLGRALETAADIIRKHREGVPVSLRPRR